MQSMRAAHTQQVAARRTARSIVPLHRQRASCGSAAHAAVAEQQVAAAPSKLQRHELLNNPAEIGSNGTATVRVKDMGHALTSSTGEDISLDAYMRLPVEQYYILDPKQIQFVSGNRFILSVPRIQLLGASLQPVIEVEVTSERDAVLLRSTDCQLNATGIMGALDSKFAMQFQTRLTWSSDAPRQLPQQQQHQQLQVVQLPEHRQQQPTEASSDSATGSSSKPDGDVPQQQKSQLRAGWDKLKSVSWPNSKKASNGNGNGGGSNGNSSSSTDGSISGAATVQVWCEVVPPFQLMPREALQRSCNVVIMGLVNSLLPWFMRQLAADYAKWAADPAYRAERRLRTLQKVVHRS